MSDVMYVSKEAYENMKEELHRMKAIERPAASRAIAEAREKGDLKKMLNMMRLKKRRECLKQK